jgi:hypothetical protein
LSLASDQYDLTGDHVAKFKIKLSAPVSAVAASVFPNVGDVKSLEKRRGRWTEQSKKRSR